MVCNLVLCPLLNKRAEIMEQHKVARKSNRIEMTRPERRADKREEVFARGLKNHLKIRKFFL